IRGLILKSGADPCAATSASLPLSLSVTLTANDCPVNGGPAVVRSTTIPTLTGLRLSASASSFTPIVWILPSSLTDFVGTYSRSGNVQGKWIVPAGSYQLAFG